MEGEKKSRKERKQEKKAKGKPKSFILFARSFNAMADDVQADVVTSDVNADADEPEA